MDLLLAIVLIVLAFSRRSSWRNVLWFVSKSKKNFADNPRLNAEAVRTLFECKWSKTKRS